MGKIAKESIDMFAVEGGKVEKAPNRMWAIALYVENELSHGSRESIFELAGQMSPAIHNLLRSLPEENRSALMQRDEADLTDPVVASYYLGKFVMMQMMLRDVGGSTMATPDIEYLKTEDVTTVLKAMLELGTATPAAIAEKAGFDIEFTNSILNRTYEIGGTSSVMRGKERVDMLAPVGKMIAEGKV